MTIQNRFETYRRSCMSDDQPSDRIKGKLISEPDHKVDRPKRVTVNIDQHSIP